MIMIPFILSPDFAVAKGKPGEGSGINQQDEIYSKTEFESKTTEPSAAQPTTPAQPANIANDAGQAASNATSNNNAPHKNASKTKYKVEYQSMCEMSGAPGDNCITLDEEVCPNGDPLITRTVSTMSGRMVAMDSYCSLEPEVNLPAEAKAEVAAIRAAVKTQRVVEVTPAKFRSFPIAPSKTASQPEGFSLRNGNAHMYAIPNPQTFNVDIFDQPVRIRAIPQSYAWKYGDGQSKRTQNPGKPNPNHTFDEPTDTSHIYKETGDYQIRLSTIYRGEFSVNGGPWKPIPGTANVPSEPMPMSVWRTKKLLVDRNCVENPDGPACDSPFLKEKSTPK
jgi:hypothetical protein